MENHNFCSYFRQNHGKTVCVGTKELDICSCGGDKMKCDFYPRVREEAAKENSIRQFETTKERLIRAEREIYELNLKLDEKLVECAELRAKIRSLENQ